MPGPGLIFDIDARTAGLKQKTAEAATIMSVFGRKARSSLDNATGGFNVFRRELNNVVSGLFSFRSVMAGAIGGGGLLLFARNALNAADALGDMAQSLGLSTKELQAYQLMALQGGLSVEKFRSGIVFLNNQIADGKLPYKTASEAIRAFSDEMARTEDPIVRAGRASEFFGQKMGSSFIPVFGQGASAIDSMTAALERQGAILGEDTIQKASLYNDQMDALFTILRVNMQQGFLEEFVGTNADLKNLLADGKLAGDLKAIGGALGELSRFIVEQLPNAITVLKVFSGALAGAAAGGIVAGPPGAAVGAAVGGAGALGTDSNFRRKAQELDDRIFGVSPKEQARRDAKAVSENPNVLHTREAIDRLKAANAAILAQGATFEKVAKQRVTSTGAVSSALKKQKEQQDAVNESTKEGEQLGKDLGFTFSSALEDAIVNGAKLSDVLRGLGQDILRIITRRAVTEPLANGISGLIGGAGGGGGLGGFFGSLGTSLFGSSPKSGIGPSSPGLFGNLFGGIGKIFGFASGGQIKPGSLGVVGEHGPELAYGGPGGVSVAPFDKVGGGGNNYYIDARGADSTAIRQLEAKLTALAGPGVVEQRVSDAMQRGQI